MTGFETIDLVPLHVSKYREQPQTVDGSLPRHKQVTRGHTISGHGFEACCVQQLTRSCCTVRVCTRLDRETTQEDPHGVASSHAIAIHLAVHGPHGWRNLHDTGVEAHGALRC